MLVSPYAHNRNSLFFKDIYILNYQKGKDTPGSSSVVTQVKTALHKLVLLITIILIIQNLKYFGINSISMN